MKKLMEKIRDYASVFKGNVAVLTVTWLLFSMAHALTFPYYSLYIKMLGGEDIHIALVRSINSIASLPLLPLGGFIADKYGRRRLVIVFTWIISIITFLYGLAPDWKILIIIGSIDSFLHFYVPALHAILIDSLDPMERAKGTMLTNFIANLPWYVVPIIGGWIVDEYGVMGMRISYIAGGMISICAAITRTLFLTETHKTIPPKESITIMLKESYIGSIRRLKILPKTITYIIVENMLIFQLSIMPLSLYGVVYSTEILKIPAQTFGLLNSLSTVASGLAAILTAGRIDKYPRVKVILYLVLVNIVSYAPFVIYPSLISLSAYYLVSSFTMSISMGVYEAYIGDLVPREHRATVNSLINISWSVGSIIASTISGILYSIEPRVAFTASLVSMVIDLFYIRAFYKEPRIIHK